MIYWMHTTSTYGKSITDWHVIWQDEIGLVGRVVGSSRMFEASDRGVGLLGVNGTKVGIER